MRALAATLHATVALGVLAVAAPALAQTAPAGGVSRATDDLLGEVTVTATRQVDTANRVALSISAVTQTSLDQQGIKNATDLQKIVPELALVNQISGVATFAIRGIAATTGAATTGVYLDDTSLTKRNNSGTFQNNGAPLPVLFDLERVEVLKGPQGTLYGGSSEGGTIRLITPTPSLTHFSGLARAEISSVKDGSTGYETGFAVGGPIVADKLGFRVSAISRLTPGYVDLLNPYANGALVRSDINWGRDQAVRAAVAWAPTERSKATLAFYYSDHSDSGNGSAVTLALPKGQTFTTPQVCFDTRRPFGASPGATAPVACAPGAVPGSTVGGIYTRPSYNYGPFDYLGGNTTISPFDGSAHSLEDRTQLDVSTLTLEYHMDSMDVKSITSYLHDRTRGGGEESQDPGHTAQTTLQNPGPSGFPLFSPYIPYSGQMVAVNKRYGLEEELRFSSPANQRPFNWVAGVFFSNLRTKIHYDAIGFYTPTTLALFGIPQSQRYGLPDDPQSRVTTLDGHLTDTEVAGFGEGNLWITDKLKLTAGVRISRVQFVYHQLNWGLLSGRTETNPFSATDGNVVSSPLTPKVGLQYQIADNQMIYLNAAKGFRAGGVNPPLNPTSCAVGLAQFGLTVNDVPRQYGPDTVWSYEAGGKFRLLDGKMQLNGAAYRIDWTGIQTAIAVQGCGQNWVQNGGKARSTGFDLQAQYRPVRPLTLSAAVGYTNAKYLEAITGPRPLSGGAPTVAVNAGDTFGVPPWQVSLSAQLDWDVLNRPAYVRLDYQYFNGYVSGTGVGTGNYNPFTQNIPSQDLFNLRVGVTMGAWDLNVFANNVTNSHDMVGNGGVGRSACQLSGGAGCTVYNTYTPFVSQNYQTPRTVGVQGNYRF